MEVNVFVSDATWKTVWGVADTPRATSAEPNPDDQRTAPSHPIAADIPGIPYTPRRVSRRAASWTVSRGGGAEPVGSVQARRTPRRRALGSRLGLMLGR
jgi:hypothetical protein